MVMRASSIAVFLVAASATATSACPVLSDLTRGIEVRTGDGNVEIHRRMDSSRTQTTISFSDGEGSVMEFHHGVYALTSIPVFNGKPEPSQIQIFGDDNAVAEWPKPEPYARWTTAGTGAADVSAGGPTTYRLGSCTYDGFQVQLVFKDDDYEETYWYLSELGIGLLVETKLGNDIDRVDYISISATN